MSYRDSIEFTVLNLIEPNLGRRGILKYQKYFTKYFSIYLECSIQFNYFIRFIKVKVSYFNSMESL